MQYLSTRGWNGEYTMGLLNTMTTHSSERNRFFFYTKWVERSVQRQGGVTELEVSGDTVCLQQVIQDLWDDGEVKMWVGRAGEASGLG